MREGEKEILTGLRHMLIRAFFERSCLEWGESTEEFCVVGGMWVSVKSSTAYR